MTRTADALVEPDLLRWARTDAGYSIPEMATKVGTTSDRIKEFEAGEAMPTINQVRKMAQACKRPLAVFFLSEPPKDFQAMRDFRRLPGRKDLYLSPELRIEIRKARYRRDRFIEIAENLGEDLPELDALISTDEDPETAATRIRDRIGLTARKQEGWSRKYEAWNGIRSVFEKAGILVFQVRKVPLEEMRGFSIAEHPYPVIAVNIADAVYGRIFTVAHELAHLLIDEGGMCDMGPEPTADPRDSSIEVFCNHFAGALLMPREKLERVQEVASANADTEWDERKIRNLARRFSVSREALLRRLTMIGAASSEFYMRKRRDYKQEYEQHRSERSGYAPPHRMPVATGGELFVRLSLEAYHADYLSPTDLSGLLEVRLKHLDDIRAQIGDNAA